MSRHQAVWDRTAEGRGIIAVSFLALVLHESLWLVGVGLAIGFPLTPAAMRAASTLICGLAPTDARTPAGATCLLGERGRARGRYSGVTSGADSSRDRTPLRLRRHLLARAAPMRLGATDRVRPALQ